MTLLHILSYAGFLAAFAFVVLSLASGLLWLSELIEEHTKHAKFIGIRAIYAIWTLHVLLWLVDSLPFKQTMFSITCHAVYLQNFSHKWPVISLTSVSFLSSCTLAVVNHFIWFMHFSHLSREARAFRPPPAYRAPPNQQLVTAPGFGEVATFFGLCIWSIPLFLFLSLSASDNILPTSASTSSVDVNESQPAPLAHPSLFKAIFDTVFRIKPKREDATYTAEYPYNKVAPASPFQNGTRFSFSPSPRPSFDRHEEYSTNSDNVRMDHVQNRLRPPPKRVTTAPGQVQSESIRESSNTNLQGEGSVIAEKVSRSSEDVSRRRKQI